MTPEPPSDEELASTLRVASIRLARAERARAQRAQHTTAAEWHLPFALLSALAALERDGPLTPAELAELEGIRRPSIARTLTTLADLGLVVRRRHPEDGRQVEAVITDEGRAAVAQTRAAVDSWFRDALAELDDRDRDLLARAAPALVRFAEVFGTSVR